MSGNPSTTARSSLLDRGRRSFVGPQHLQSNKYNYTDDDLEDFQQQRWRNRSILDQSPPSTNQQQHQHQNRRGTSEQREYIGVSKKTATTINSRIGDFHNTSYTTPSAEQKHGSNDELQEEEEAIRIRRQQQQQIMSIAARQFPDCELEYSDGSTPQTSCCVPLAVAQQQLRPLVLDATSHRTPKSTSYYNDHKGSIHKNNYSAANGIGMMGRFMEAALGGNGGGGSLRRQMNHRPDNYQYSQQPIQNQQYDGVLQKDEQHSAARLARQAPQAGFLFKQGQNVPALKRRFFVLQPSTHLYYYLSPVCKQPRGCLDLLGSWLEEFPGELADGRFRFAVCWDKQKDDQEDGDNKGQRHPDPTSQNDDSVVRVILEARSKQVGLEWMDSLQRERLPAVKEKLAESQCQTQSLKARCKELEKQLQTYKWMEKDLAGAVQDATRWRQDFEKLDDAIRRLAMHVVRQEDEEDSQQIENEQQTAKNESFPSSLNGNSGDCNYDGDCSENDEESDKDNEESQRPAAIVTKKTKDDEGADVTDALPAPSLLARETSFLDEAVLEFEEDGDKQRWMNDAMMKAVPGVHFSALWNACEQVRASLRLASTEAATAVEDLQGSHKQQKQLEKKFQNAEKHLMKLWEENCSLRKGLKEKKQEKRVLIREVRSLRESSASARAALNAKTNSQTTIVMHEQQTEQQTPPCSLVPPTVEAPAPENSSKQGTFTNHMNDISAIDINSDEEKLIDDLEQSVLSSIRLHEQYMATTEGDTITKSGTKLAARNAIAESKNTGFVLETAKNRESLPSLLDDDDDDQISKHASDDKGIVHESKQQSIAREDSNKSNEAPSIIDADLGRTICHRHDSLVSASSSQNSTPEKRNPLLQLEEENANDEKQPKLCAVSSSQSESSKSNKVTVDVNGKANSVLACPLADVVGHDTTPSSGRQNINEGNKSNSSVALAGGPNSELQIYHLTFYSRKIGLQFQKVPPPPAKQKGLLTDALTADLNTFCTGADEKTGAELRRIANIRSSVSDSGQNKNHGQNDQDLSCQIAAPVDAVLVCGFEGFDDTGSNVRPKLGARLVAFDGVSVEIGKWTFDAIRKAIHARGRPLTLSFRNDYLTTEQRSYLTVAVQQEAVPREALQYENGKQGVSKYKNNKVHHDHVRTSSMDPSVQSALTHETDHFVNVYDDDLSASIATAASSDQYSRRNQHHYKQPRANNASSSVRSVSSSSNGSHTANYSSFRGASFSDVGSSSTSVFSSVVSPLVSNLLASGRSTGSSSAFTPEYLRREPKSVDYTPQHQDFKSELL